MNLFLNSPAHYTEEFGVIDEIYNMCNYISKNIDINNYTNAIDTIGIVPMIAPKEILEETSWREIQYVSTKFRMANISLSLDYDSFCNYDLENKKKIILENVFNSLKIIKKRLGEDFNYQQLEADILSLLTEQ